MNYLLLLTIVSSICTILGFAISLFASNFIKSPIWKWFVIGFILFIVTFVSGWIANLNSENERLKNIHRQATAIYEDYEPLVNEMEFIQEALTFLEENKNRYPDSYGRAVEIYTDMKNSTIQYSYEPATQIHGIIKGIATTNGEKPN